MLPGRHRRRPESAQERARWRPRTRAVATGPGPARRLHGARRIRGTRSRVRLGRTWPTWSGPRRWVRTTRRLHGARAAYLGMQGRFPRRFGDSRAGRRDRATLDPDAWIRLGSLYVIGVISPAGRGVWRALEIAPEDERRSYELQSLILTVGQAMRWRWRSQATWAWFGPWRMAPGPARLSGKPGSRRWRSTPCRATSRHSGRVQIAEVYAWRGDRGQGVRVAGPGLCPA